MLTILEVNNDAWENNDDVFVDFGGNEITYHDKGLPGYDKADKRDQRNKNITCWISQSNIVIVNVEENKYNIWREIIFKDNHHGEKKTTTI